MIRNSEVIESQIRARKVSAEKSPDLGKKRPVVINSFTTIYVDDFTTPEDELREKFLSKNNGYTRRIGN